jgi:hypothetical protein
MIKNRLLIQFLSIGIFFLFQVNCSNKEKSINTSNGIFDTSMINAAWLEKDSVYFKNYIHFLKSPYLTSQEFFYLLIRFDVTSFSFGIIDINDTYWLNASENEKKIRKQNICTVLEIYSNSNLFLKENIFEIAQDFQSWYYKDNFNKREYLNEVDKVKILEKLNSYK